MPNNQGYLNAYEISVPAAGTGAFNIILIKGGPFKSNVSLTDAAQPGENINVLGDFLSDTVTVSGRNNGTTIYIGIGTVNGISGVIIRDPNAPGNQTKYYFLTGGTFADNAAGNAALSTPGTNTWTLSGPTSVAPVNQRVTDDIAPQLGTVIGAAHGRRRVVCGAAAGLGGQRVGYGTSYYLDRPPSHRPDDASAPAHRGANPHPPGCVRREHIARIATCCSRPITPSSPMASAADLRASVDQRHDPSGKERRPGPRSITCTWNWIGMRFCLPRAYRRKAISIPVTVVSSRIPASRRHLSGPLTDESDCPARETASCAPFVWDEASVRPVWEALAKRAAVLGLPVPRPATVSDPELRILVNGCTLRPVSAKNGRHVFILPKGTTEIRLVSCAGAPRDTQPWREDRRRLGAYVKRIVLREENEMPEIPFDDPDLSGGWWAVERIPGCLLRWTNGDAELPLRRNARILEIDVATSNLTYLTNVDADREAA